jgi:hypothetical protein
MTLYSRPLVRTTYSYETDFSSIFHPNARRLGTPATIASYDLSALEELVVLAG